MKKKPKNKKNNSFIDLREGLKALNESEIAHKFVQTKINRLREEISPSKEYWKIKYNPTDSWI